MNNAKKHFSNFTITNQGSNRENRQVFSLDLNADRVLDDVTSDGRLFNVLAGAAMKGNAWSPMVREVCR